VELQAVTTQARAAKMRAGRAAFNRGEFFAAHERWEELWLDLRSPTGGPPSLRQRVQGLIQIAAGLHHLQGGRRRPATTLLRRGLAKLTAVHETPIAGANLWPAAAVTKLCRDLTRFITQLEDGDAVPPDPARLKLGGGGGKSEPEGSDFPTKPSRD
jgi:hypothetical protein